MRRFKLLSVLLVVAISFSLSIFVSYVFPYKVFGQIPLPDEDTLMVRRQAEVATNFVVQPPDPDRRLRPAERVRRDTYGDVGLTPVKTLA
jgi:hypothetical protein